MSEPKVSITEGKEAESDWPMLKLVGILILWEILRGVLSLWLIRPIAVGLAAFATMLVSYRIIPQPKARFVRWAFGSLLIVASLVGLFYGLVGPVCYRLGSTLAGGLLGFVMFLFVRFFAAPVLLRKVEGELWKWLAISAGWPPGRVFRVH